MLKKYINRLTPVIKTVAWFLRANESDLKITPKSLQGTNMDYTKFIVLAHARSGSSMVIGTLRKHPNVIGFGELFLSQRVVFNIKDFNNNSGKLLYLRNKYPTNFLEESIFTYYRKDVEAVGFKLFPEQLEKSHFRIIWKWLAANKDIKIILLRRENLLATYTSLLVAVKTGTYGMTTKSKRTNATVTIDYKKCLHEFQKQKTHHDNITERLKGHDVLEVSYEEMIKNIDAHTTKFQNFLNVKSHPIKINTVKNEVRSLSEVITNYEDLRNKFSNTEWSYLFDE